MLPLSLYRNRRLRPIVRLLRHPVTRVILAVTALYNVFQVWHIYTVLAASEAAAHAAASPSPLAGQPHRRPVPEHSRRVYIASVHWNNARVMRSHWNAAVVALVDRLGPENVYVSAHENGSWDDTKVALAELDEALDARGVRRTVSTSDVTHRDLISGPPGDAGWVRTPRGDRALRRIPYLAQVRNQSLRKLRELRDRDGIEFDRVLFLNDVVFTVDDVLELLDTNGGRYAAACAIDYKSPPMFYDTFALRDSEGHEPVMQTWPYFRSRRSRQAMVENAPVPVTSCWNGVVAMPTDPFLASTPLSFRGVTDSLAAFHLEGSECCLIHADNSASSQLGVFVNPRVRVGYNGAAYEATHPSGGGSWVSVWEIARGLWVNRLGRWWAMVAAEPELWEVRHRLGRWRRQGEQGAGSAEPRIEPGPFCLIDEMQVLVANGWAHV